MTEPAARGRRRPGPNRRAVSAAAAALLLGGAAAGCGAGGDSGSGGPLTVFAAASLTEVFTDLGERFEEETGTRVDFNFAGSSDLALQIADGAPADVFASADTRTMDDVAGDGLVRGEPRVFARNELRIAVPEGNPAGIEGLEDLADPGTRVALCAEEVPCGAAARKLLDAQGVEVSGASQEEDVKAALTRARLGEVDAALVYTTDVRSAGGEVEGVPVEGADEAANDYPIAVVKDAAAPQAAQEWVDFVLSDEGQGALADAGFSPGGDA
ncbi:molybdate ABC transporter substrate-binding protein [Nocardiopsis sp. RSe5-2]|uniref:Molybdate ABC transporter substrate-binding protein n=1 Tax=Nocardiopsis endophytica TaxID=3018445 RepID=A0ABT4U9M5_9ACTN|nr:molybdate ABC transporter substrate-binding protein [Nocardiopsis endophytica]MDA2813655.1 molybdate ABC transporter substrate-binding protein [Nocardiopsis endophytica]